MCKAGRRRRMERWNHVLGMELCRFSETPLTSERNVYLPCRTLHGSWPSLEVTKAFCISLTLTTTHHDRSENYATKHTTCNDIRISHHTLFRLIDGSQTPYTLYFHFVLNLSCCRRQAGLVSPSLLSRLLLSTCLMLRWDILMMGSIRY